MALYSRCGRAGDVAKCDADKSEHQQRREPERHAAEHIHGGDSIATADIVMLEFVALGPELSSLAVYSRSRYGRYDFAKDRKLDGRDQELPG